MNIDSATRMDIDSDTQMNIDSNTRMNIDSDTRMNIDSDTRMDIDSDTRMNIDSDTRMNIDSDNRMNIDSDNRMNIDSDTRMNIDSDTRRNTNSDTRMNINSTIRMNSDSDTPIFVALSYFRKFFLIFSELLDHLNVSDLKTAMWSVLASVLFLYHYWLTIKQLLDDDRYTRHQVSTFFTSINVVHCRRIHVIILSYFNCSNDNISLVYRGPGWLNELGSWIT